MTTPIAMVIVGSESIRISRVIRVGPGIGTPVIRNFRLVLVVLIIGFVVAAFDDPLTLDDRGRSFDYCFPFVIHT
jgi:hypothetical protein